VLGLQTRRTVASRSLAVASTSRTSCSWRVFAETVGGIRTLQCCGMFGATPAVRVRVPVCPSSPYLTATARSVSVVQQPTGFSFGAAAPAGTPYPSPHCRRGTPSERALLKPHACFSSQRRLRSARRRPPPSAHSSSNNPQALACSGPRPRQANSNNPPPAQADSSEQPRRPPLVAEVPSAHKALGRLALAQRLARRRPCSARQNQVQLLAGPAAFSLGPGPVRRCSSPGLSRQPAA
jgi:hypothetical protein